jgi:hypothetical protein
VGNVFWTDCLQREVLRQWRGVHKCHFRVVCMYEFVIMVEVRSVRGGMKGARTCESVEYSVCICYMRPFL